ncbi:MAG: M1 family metallopeptidase [Pirellulaceae bacterium]
MLNTRFVYSLILVSLLSVLVNAQEETGSDVDKQQQQRLRGSITPERAWWDLLHYDLQVQFSPEDKTIQGSNAIRFKVVGQPLPMQIDLQPPLEIDSIDWQGQALNFTRDGNVFLIEFPEPLKAGSQHEIEIRYSGTPTESKNPPWSGGVSWKTDDNGKPFIATSCQGIGASIWWPCKDHGYDEPDDGVDITLTVPDGLTAVSNGRLITKWENSKTDTASFHWRVTNPINNYAINANIGDYVNFSEKYDGERGSLDMDYWVLRDHRDVAETQFKEAPRTLAAFEHWFGPYPFYEDSYKLVEVPYLGMEHQSSVTYGNGYKNGYRGSDLSATGVGMKFDFIIVHESGHEWFGNNISMRDAADMWIHESFTNYSENLFVEYHFTKQEAQDYVIGCRRRIRNDEPIVGTYGLNRSGSGDMYYKGGNMLHTLRHMVNDDDKWRTILRGLNETFWHQTVSSEQVERYLSQQTDMNLTPFFDQYLRTTQIPVFEYELGENGLRYRFDDVVDGFSMPLRVYLGEDKVEAWIEPNSEWQSISLDSQPATIEVDRNFYVETRKPSDK